MAYGFIFFPPIKEILIFIEKACKDLFGLVLIFILVVLGISLTYYQLLRNFEISEGKNYDLLNSFDYVLSEFVEGFPNLPDRHIGTPI